MVRVNFAVRHPFACTLILDEFANMLGSVPITSTLALANANLPYVLALSNKGYRQALKGSPALLKGLKIIGGK